MNRLLVLTESPPTSGTAVWGPRSTSARRQEIHIVTATCRAPRSRAAHPTPSPASTSSASLAAPRIAGVYARFFFKSLALALTHRFDAITPSVPFQKGWWPGLARLSFRRRHLRLTAKNSPPGAWRQIQSHCVSHCVTRSVIATASTRRHPVEMDRSAASPSSTGVECRSSALASTPVCRKPRHPLR